MICGMNITRRGFRQRGRGDVYILALFAFSLSALGLAEASGLAPSAAQTSKNTRAKEAMFFYTDTTDCPWTIIKSDDKKRARLNCMQHFLYNLDYPDKDDDVVIGPDPLVVGSPAQVLREDLQLDNWPLR